MKITRVSGSSILSIRQVVGAVALLGALAVAGATGCTTTVSTSGGGCSTDSSVSCSGGAAGYSCDGDSQPGDSNPDLICSADQGTGEFCCFPDSSCQNDSSVSCAGGAFGYSCGAGDNPPDSTNPLLVCSVPTTVGNEDTYCCYTNTVVVTSSATCVQDPSVTQNCSGDSFGFSCTGSDTPDQDFGSNLNCSSPTSGMDASGTPASLYCCTD
jgi:hypothetical protein